MLFSAMLAGSFRSPGRHILDFRPAIGTASLEASVPRRPPGGEQSRRWRSLAAQLPSGGMFAEPTWDGQNKLVWLGGFGVLLALLITYLLRVQAKRRATEQIAARGREFQEILAGMAADLIATPDCLGTGEMKSWLKPFLRYFGFEWASLFELLDGGGRAVPLYSDAYEGASAVPFVPNEEGPQVTDVLPNIAVLASDPDEVMGNFHGLKDWLLRLGSRSFAILPLRVDGQLLGALVFASAQQKLEWPGEWMDELQTIANVFANTIKRKRAEDALRASEEFKESILGSFASHVAVIDREGRILLVNSKWRMFSDENGGGSDPSVSPGANYLAECTKASEKGDFYATQALMGITAVMVGERPCFEMVYPCHSLLEQRWFSMVVTPLTRAEGGAVIKHTDVTQQRIADSRLRESENRFRLMADTAPVMIWMSGLDRLCNYFNQGWLDFTGRTLHQELGSGWTEGVHPDDLQRCVQTYNRAFDERQKFTMEYRLRRADGQYRWIVDSGVPRFLSDGTFAGYIGCCFDITERKELATARMEFSGRLIQAQEEERARIARELHDDIGQRLALLAIDIQQLDGILSGVNDALHYRMQSLWKQLNDISTDAGRISHQLHSSKLQLLGLALAVRGLCDDFSKQHDIHIDYTCTGVPPELDSTVSLNLFRVAQEALHNVARHSHARRVKVKLRGNNSEIRLSVHDDGKGFDVDTAFAGEGLGLISMTERLRLVGGNFSIRSEPSFGTRVVARVPLGSRESAPGRRSRDTAA
jgi:PAS domain S-box-containing protein